MKTFMVILIGFIGVSAIYSQEKPESPKYALSFGIAGNFTLDKFNGSIAVKKILDDTHQIRLYLSPSIGSSKDETDNEAIIKKGTHEVLSLSLGVGADYLWTLLKDDDINMFGGTGLSFTYGYYKDKTVTPNSSGDENISEMRSPSTNLGIRGILGVEWRVSKKIGIHSEYLLSGFYGWEKTELRSNSLVNPDRTALENRLSLYSGVLFGVSIYL
ncbi:MAG: hypothetical protein WCS69_16505 [Ignavibacteriaceae bacterium]